MQLLNISTIANVLVADANRTVDATFTVAKGTLIELMTWKLAMVKMLKGNRDKYVDLWQLELANQEFHFKLANLQADQGPFGKNIQWAHGPLSIGRRFVREAQMKHLRDISVDYDIDFECSLFTTIEETAGIAFVANVQQHQLVISLPFGISKKEKRNITDITAPFASTAVIAQQPSASGVQPGI